MGWRDDLPEEFRGNEGLKKFETVEALAKSYLHSEARNSNSIRIVGPDASVEDRTESIRKVMTHMPELMLKPNLESAEQSAEFHLMLGVPETIEGYDSGEIKLDDETLNEIKLGALADKLTKSQFKSQIKRFEEMNEFSVTQNNDARTRAGAELKGKWGLAFPDRYAVVERHLEENPGVGKIGDMSPAQIEAHYAIAMSQFGTAQMHDQPTPTSNILTPEEAQAQIVEIHKNPLFLDGFNDREGHKKLLARRIELMQIANQY